MNARDLAWRAAGASLLAAGFIVGSVARANAPTPSASVAILGLFLALSGIVLLVQGKRVPLAIRIERSKHRALPMAVHERRVRGRRVRGRRAAS